MGCKYCKYINIPLSCNPCNHCIDYNKFEMINEEVRWKIKGLADDHPVQKEFNEYMKKRYGYRQSK